MSSAFVFPGQGSQAVGMLAGWQAHPSVADTLAEADDALGFALSRLIGGGPADELNLTHNAQPALLAAGVAAYRAWRAAGGAEPAAMAGHSLGEYTALVCAGVLPFAEALRLVRRRGELMQQAVPLGQAQGQAQSSGAMAAILGLDAPRVQEVCAAAADGEVVEAVNFNAPGQVVIAGHRAAVERAVEQARAAGARRAVTLAVSVPAHSSLMRPAAQAFAADLQAATMTAPAVPVINNVDVLAQQDPAQIRDALLRQLYSPVRWIEVVEALRDRGAATLIECGPGKVLAGLARRIDAQLQIHALTDGDALQAALQAVKEEHDGN